MSSENYPPVRVECYIRVFEKNGKELEYLVLYNPFGNDVLYLQLENAGTLELLRDKFMLPVKWGEKQGK